MNLALNNLHRLIFHKSQTNKYQVSSTLQSILSNFNNGVVYFRLDLWSPFQPVFVLSLWEQTKCTYDNYYHRPIFPFSSLARSKYLYIFLVSIFSLLYVLTVIILLLARFSQELLEVIFHGSLSETKSPQVSKTLLYIIAKLWSKWSQFFLWFPMLPIFSQYFVTVPHAPNNTGITVTLTFHRFIYLFIFLVLCQSPSISPSLHLLPFTAGTTVSTR